MNIVSKLPTEIQNKIFLYLSNPEANVIRNGKETFAKDAINYCRFCKKLVRLAKKIDKRINPCCLRTVIDMFQDQYNANNKTPDNLIILLRMKQIMTEMLGQWYNRDLYHRLKYSSDDMKINFQIFDCFNYIKNYAGVCGETTYYRGTCEIYEPEDWNDFNDP